MSKYVKQMEMDALKKTFGDVRDLVLLKISGLSAITENQMRLALRKKNVRMQLVKNSLASRVFKELGLPGLETHLSGPTTLAWGSTGIADLSREIDAFIKKNAKTIMPKAAVADGALVTFDEAKKFPTRAQAIGEVMGLILGPGRQLLGLLQGPGGKLTGQLKTIADRKEEAAPEPAAPIPSAAAPAAT